MSEGERAESDESGRTPASSTLPSSTSAQPIRKIKPPSATFLSGLPTAGEPPSSSSAPAASVELEGPSSPNAPDIIFEGPAPTASEVRAPQPSQAEAVAKVESVEATRPSPAKEKIEATEETGVQASYSKERLLAELRELSLVISGVESLKFLMPRINRSLDEGVDAHALVSFYRIASRTLLEELQQAKAGTDQIRRELETARSRLNKKELELAAAEAANPNVGASGPASKEVQEKMAAMQAELVQVNEQREKLLVDFRNMRDRSIKDVELRVFKEKERFFKAFLPVLDSFERAQQTMKSSSDATVLQEGMNLIATLLQEALRQEGLEPVDVSGSFDPRFHEAVGEVETDQKEDDHVFDELSRGYRLGERLIRPAMIRVARNPSGVVKSPLAQESVPSGEE